MSSLFTLISLLFSLNNALSRQLLATTENTYEYDLIFTIYFIWNTTNKTISYTTIYSSITAIIENTDHTLQSLTDESINQNDLTYINKSQSISISINLLTKHSDLKIYKNLFTINTRQTINVQTNSIYIKNVIVSIHLIETPPKTNLTLILSISIALFLCIVCCTYCIYNQRKHGKLRKIRMEFSKPNEEWIYNNGSKMPDLNNTDPFQSGKYWGYYEQHSRNDTNKTASENSNSEHTMLDIDLEFTDNPTERYPIVTGTGTDSIGQYDIKGIYCIDSKRMSFEQIYNEENIVQVRLEWNVNQNQFKGNWYTKKNKVEQFGYWIISKCDDIIMDVINQKEETNISNMTSINSAHISNISNMTSTTIVIDNSKHIGHGYNMVSGMSYSSTVSAKDKNNKQFMRVMIPQGSIDSFKSTSGGNSTVGSGTPSDITATNMNNMNKKKSYESICGIRVNGFKVNDLPPGWREDITTDGRVYWQKDGTNEVLWEKPTHNIVKTMNKQKSKHKHDESTGF